ncbi:hypothetical protein SAMD00019534_036790 [Acytostelium subglobosum LB1]|uniref:hypothetical protein n=1 Tax=Acytostelium subglobosum LB1 TaxID=1410327 RepID=UPI000645205A|nr:hypothetical protein SAMD00019534_036790 [Acytostelium subglobosum LB1]GAM20504.1 hypothetical protein SAMD00019534_036790 [Acytostelium subglobosum LB1]|eukprot:XP_012760025.1 hypothetical protein SAMD00019534_036790 [Acytostelium subglobosum LB1]
MMPHLTSRYAPFKLPLRCLTLNDNLLLNGPNETKNEAAFRLLVEGLTEFAGDIQHSPVRDNLLPHMLKSLDIRASLDTTLGEEELTENFDVIQCLGIDYPELERLVVRIELDESDDREQHRDVRTDNDEQVCCIFSDLCNCLFQSSAFEKLLTFELESWGDSLALGRSLGSYPGHFFSRLHRSSPNLRSLSLNLNSIDAFEYSSMRDNLIWFLDQTPTCSSLRLGLGDVELVSNILPYLLQSDSIKTFNHLVPIGLLPELKRPFHSFNLAVYRGTDLDDVQTIAALESLRLVDLIILSNCKRHKDIVIKIERHLHPPSRFSHWTLTTR